MDLIVKCYRYFDCCHDNLLSINRSQEQGYRAKERVPFILSIEKLIFKYKIHSNFVIIYDFQIL